MDEESRGFDQAEDGQNGNSLLGHAHHWTSGSLLLAVLACSLVPDRIGVGGGHTFNSGSHLGSAWNPDRLTNDRNKDSNNVFVYAEYDIKPQKTEIVNLQEFLRTPPSKLPELYTPWDDGEPDILYGIDMLSEGLDVIEDTSWSTIEKIVYLSTAFAVLGLVIFGLKITMKKKN